MRNLIGIARVSTIRQLKNGNSVQDQIEQIENFSRKENFKLLDVVRVQASGKHQLLNVGQLAETIKRARELGAEIVVTKLDRLSRDTITLLTLRKASSESGVEIHVASMNRKISEISDIEFNLLSFMAEQERKMISQRTKEATRNRIGTFGSTLNAKEMNQRSIAKRVNLAKAWASSVHLKDQILEAVSALKSPTLVNVARWLNGNNLPTRRGKKWTKLNLHEQINRLGWSWVELKKQQ